MKAVQIRNYSKEIKTTLCEVPQPDISDSQVLIRVKAAAVNPLELLILTGSIKLMYNYKMPLTLGNECSGIIEQVGKNVKGFSRGDFVYTRLPVKKIGAFAEYVNVEETAVAKMPKGYDFAEAAAIPLTGLTAYQAITEELEVKPGDAILITGGSGSFGQMAVPVAKALGLYVIVTGNSRARARMLALGADQYLDYRKENYWEIVSDVDGVIDTLGNTEFDHELSVLKKGGRLVSLRTGPNRMFAVRNQFPLLQRMLFAAAGAKYDRAAAKQGKEYRFIFVREDGTQLEKITEIVERNHIVPVVDPHVFSLLQVNEALELVKEGQIDGKVIIRIS